MDIKAIVKHLRDEGIVAVMQRAYRRHHRENKPFRILLLTNRDSDNVGDQIIEACDISLVKAVMQDLGISKNQYVITSLPAFFISKSYKVLNTDAPDPKTVIAQSDVVLFGGAPMFNYKYQDFYRRSIDVIKIARKYGKPVLFSAIGIDAYDEDDARCQALKAELNSGTVPMITTRDGMTYLEHYKENDTLTIAKVADPAVFSGSVFRPYLAKKSRDGKRTVGLFVFRAGGFRANGIDFSRTQAAEMWLRLIKEIQARGYDYELLTSGHFADEAFMEYLISAYKVDDKKCVFNINCPEDLINRISSYAGVVSCRLHPSIISYALDVPSVGIIWNSKVSGFYESVGYGERAFTVSDLDVKKLMDGLEQAMGCVIAKDKQYLMSVYAYLADALSGITHNNRRYASESYSELCKRIPPYEGTTQEQLQMKLRDKFRRAYRAYNKVLTKK